MKEIKYWGIGSCQICLRLGGSQTIKISKIFCLSSPSPHSKSILSSWGAISLPLILINFYIHLKPFPRALITLACNPSYLGSWDQKGCTWKPAGVRSCKTSSQPIAGYGAVHLSSQAIRLGRLQFLVSLGKIIYETPSQQ
jgi:hypothetical protein